MNRARQLLAFGLLALAHCGPSTSDRSTAPLAPPPPPMAPAGPGVQLSAEGAPTARLPADVRPTHYTLSLEIAPERQRFAGTVEIAVQLDRPRDVLWIHGKGLVAKQASVRPEGGAPVAARWELAHPSGVVALRLPRPIGPGKATLHIDYEAPFGERLEGLYRVKEAGKSYAFTQFEAIFAREAFPCFDEPAFKTPFDVTLFVPKDDEAIANTHELEHSVAPNGLKRVVFATTAPLPTYLLAFAVGPLDVVAAPPIPPNATRKRPLPFRGVAARGRGKELAYALENTPAILASLEGYFGIEYPYDKLDILAVPDKGGAMENAGAVTFREWLVLVDPKDASIDQQRAFASVTAHELAHMWFGDLVTMPWWDDIWLNEAFATWMQTRVVKSIRPDHMADVTMLDRVHDAMGADSLISARQIRQEVRDVNDIANAFDQITYVKGGGVIGMIERWIGPEPFQRGVRQYMDKKRFATATATDLLASLSEASGRDVATPFRTFLDQPGVPYVEASLACDKQPRLVLKQSRYLPLGSAGDPNRLWQIPICASYPRGKGVKESCTLLTAREGTLPLDAGAKEGGGCPAWVLPNADGAGYFRWSMPAADLGKLTGAGWSRLSARERMSVAQSLRTGFARGTTPAADVLSALAPFASDPNRNVATAPMDFIRTARDWLAGAERTAAEAYGRKLYGQVGRDLGWGSGKKEKGKREDPERGLLRRDVLSFLALSAKDPDVRKEGARLGRAYVGFGKDGAIHPEAVDPNVAGLALALAVDEGDAALFDALMKKLGELDDEVVRGRIISALSTTHKPELMARALSLTLDPRVKIIEALAPIDTMLGDPDTRDVAWQWFLQNLDAIAARMPPARSGSLPWFGARFCDKAHADQVAQVFGPRIATLEGGPRNLSGATEAITLCSARRGAQTASMRAFFQKTK